MPYENLKDLPDSVRNNLPHHAQEIYRAAFNNAWEEYANSSRRVAQTSREETAHRVAWAAVKRKYIKKGTEWQER